MSKIPEDYRVEVAISSIIHQLPELEAHELETLVAFIRTIRSNR